MEVAVIMDSQGLVHHWSALAQRLFGYSAKQAQGRSLGDLIVPERARPFHEAGLRRYAETREPHCVGQVVQLNAIHGRGHEVGIKLQILPREENGQLYFDAHMEGLA